MERDAHGRFACKPVPAAVERPHLPARMTAREMRQIVRDIANLPVVLHDARGGRRTTSLFEASVWRIATGQVSRRASPIRFVELVRETARFWESDGRYGPMAGSTDSERLRLGAMIRTTPPVELDVAYAGLADTLRALIRKQRRLARP